MATYPSLALILLAWMVAMECLAPDCTSQSTVHWAFLERVCSRFTPFLALTLQDRKMKEKEEKEGSVSPRLMGQRSRVSLGPHRSRSDCPPSGFDVP